GSTQGDLTPVIEIGHAADMVGRSERAELDLDELRRRKFEFVFCLGRRVVAIALAEPADAVDREFLLTLKTNAGTDGESKNVLGLYVLPRTGILCPRSAAPPKKTGGRPERNGVRSSRLDLRSHRLSHSPFMELTRS